MSLLTASRKSAIFKITARYILITFFSEAFTWLLHEFAHWIAGEWLGNSMRMTLNSTKPITGNYNMPWHEHFVSAAGPVITLLQASLCFLLLKKNGKPYLFVLLFTCLYMRLLAGCLNVVNLNDEGRISKHLGLGTYTVSAFVVAILGYQFFRVIKIYNIQRSFIVVTAVLIMLFSSILILADQYWQPVVLGR